METGMFDFYKHIDEDKAPAPFNMDQIADWAAQQNYGAHRMLCALTKAIERQWGKPTDLSEAIRKVADKHTI